MHSGFAALRNDCTMNVGVRVTPKPMSKALAANIARIRELFEEGLSRFGGPWLAGSDFSAVDAFFAPVAFRIRPSGLDDRPGPAWVAHLSVRPAAPEWERPGAPHNGRRE